MSFMGGLLGTGGGNSGSAGMNYNAQPANLLLPTTTPQAQNAYGQAQSGLNQQQEFVNALQAQNGIGNQSAVFNQQQALANQIQGVANGTGPNPALQQLQNTTGQNVQNQAALMASQRGTGANAGLLARQAGMQGANIQQQAAGQGAALSAQQQLAGMGLLQGQQQLLGNTASQQVGQQQQGILGYNQAAQSEQQNLLNSIGQQNNAQVAMQSNINNANEGIANTTAQGQQGLLGGALNGASSLAGTVGASIFGGGVPLGGSSSIAAPQGAAVSGGGGSSLSHAKGGMIQKFDQGGSVQVNDASASGPQSNAGRFLFSSAPNQNSANQPVTISQLGQPNEGSKALSQSSSNLFGGIAKGIGSLFEEGGKVDPKKASEKAVKKGDSLKNDKVPALLSAGEIVIPRHVTQSEDPVGNSAKFVAAVMAKQGKRGRMS